ncbi:MULTISPECIES: hypothetical protein [unclassified Streptomyces]|nr:MULTISPECIES: hypothetical protein [unclassified Streptomyces]MDF3142852.1 hypothetical protein [Streptomyces sp. T21Q-yed]WDF42373.1 hypothetical protein PBV52_39055 [Streptomyces sp. T12]
MSFDTVVQSAQSPFESPSVLGKERQHGALIGVEGIQLLLR